MRRGPEAQDFAEREGRKDGGEEDSRGHEDPASPDQGKGQEESGEDEPHEGADPSSPSGSVESELLERESGTGGQRAHPTQLTQGHPGAECDQEQSRNDLHAVGMSLEPVHQAVHAVEEESGGEEWQREPRGIGGEKESGASRVALARRVEKYRGQDRADAGRPARREGYTEGESAEIAAGSAGGQDAGLEVEYLDEVENQIEPEDDDEETRDDRDGPRQSPEA